jgi:hypothetical protein
MRFPEVDLSDQRRSHKSGPFLRFFLIKLQFCIVILLGCSSGAPGPIMAHAEKSTKNTPFRRLIRWTLADFSFLIRGW